MINWWYKLFVNFCSAVLFNSTSFQVPVFKMSTFTLNIVALFTTVLMLLPITKRTDFLFFFFFLFMFQHNEERGLSFQTDFFDSLKTECCESQNCGRHYTNIIRIFVLTPLKQLLQKRKIRCCITSQWLFLADTYKDYKPKKKSGRSFYGELPILLIFTWKQCPLFSPSHALVAACSTKP